MSRPGCRQGGWWLALAGCALLAGCQRRPPSTIPSARTHYVVGDAWHAGHNWFYPREAFDQHTSGIATIASYAPGQVLADGAVFRAGMVAGGHQTLQLPAVVRVTNLQNGRQIALRLDDRGPADPGRVLALSPRAAALLGAQGPIPVSIDEDTAYSQALAQRYGGGTKLQIATAPIGSVTAESLPPPGSPVDAPRIPFRTTTAQIPADASLPAYPDRPAETITVMPLRPVAFAIDAGSFSDRGYAMSFAQRIGGRFETSGGRHPSYQVLAGPYRSIDDADRALDLARQVGLTGARIIVE